MNIVKELEAIATSIAVEHDWEQGHSGLLRLQPDYNDDEIIEEDEVEEWLDRGQVAEICPSCASKMDAQGICRIKASVIKAAEQDVRSRQAKTKRLRTTV